MVIKWLLQVGIHEHKFVGMAYYIYEYTINREYVNIQTFCIKFVVLQVKVMCFLCSSVYIYYNSKERYS